MQSREDIGQCFLQGKSYGHTTNAQGCQDGGNGNSIILKNDKKTHCVDDAVDNGIQQCGFGHFLLRAFDLHVNNAVYGAGNDPGNRQNDDSEQDIGEDFDEWVTEMTGIDNPIETDDEAEGNWHAAECIDEDELPSGFIGRDVSGYAPMNDAVDGNPGGKGDGENTSWQDKHFQKMCPVNPTHPFHI